MSDIELMDKFVTLWLLFCAVGVIYTALGLIGLYLKEKTDEDTGSM